MHSEFVEPVRTDEFVEVDVPDEAEDDEDEDEGDVGLWLLPHPTKPTATTDPMKDRTSRRLKGG